MTKTEQQRFETLDIWLSSFLSLYNIPPKLELKNGKVIFTFPISNDLYKLMANYNSNVCIPVTDFVVAVKALRGQMLTLRGQK